MPGPRHDIQERTFQFALRIVNLCQVLERMSGVTRSLGKQLLRSGTSVGANLREAKFGQSRADFVAKYSIALKESHETAYWLALLAESGLMKRDRLANLSTECNEITSILASIVKKTKAHS
jgi:four helix bundle protein